MFEGKLLRIERTVNIYKKEEDMPFCEIDVNEVSFEILLTIVTPNADDPLLYDGYELNANQLELLNGYLITKIAIEVNIYDYILVSGGIYEWPSSS